VTTSDIVGSYAPLTIADDAARAGEIVARRVLEASARSQARSGPFVLGFPSGRTPVAVIEALGRLAGRIGADLSATMVAMMDEYVVFDHGIAEYCDAAAHFSCHRWAHEVLLKGLNRNLPTARQLRAENIRFPDPKDPGAYDTWLRRIGGIDFFLLASGASDGHVGFNPPGSALDTETRVVTLADSTRQDNLGTFPEFEGIEAVPTAGVTVGLATITSARASTLLLTGSNKTAALQRILARRGFDPAFPASVIYACARPSIVADKAAAESPQ